MQRYFGEGAPALYRFSSAGKLRWLEERLSRFWFVGCYRNVDLLANRVSAELNIPGSPERQNTDTLRIVTKQGLSPELAERIERENAVDGALYRRWRDRGFDPSGNPDPGTIDLPTSDQLRDLAAEVDLGIRKKWLRWVAGFNKRDFSD